MAEPWTEGPPPKIVPRGPVGWWHCPDQAVPGGARCTERDEHSGKVCHRRPHTTGKHHLRAEHGPCFTFPYGEKVPDTYPDGRTTVL